MVTETEAGLRLDQFLAQRLEFSRARLQRWLKDGLVRLNGEVLPGKYRLRPHQVVTLTVPAPEPSQVVAEALPLEIIYEDRDLIVINKPPGLVVHPGAGHRSGTLLNALLHHCPDLQEIGDVSRPGLVHRLDKDTSGLLMAAKTELAHHSLVQQFKDQQVSKRYLALVWGRLPTREGRIAGDIGRHLHERRKMSVRSRRGKPALTLWQVRQEYSGPLTLVELSPRTGRTHQLRVHLASQGHPVVGDAAYGGGAARLKAHPRLQNLRPLVARQLLHAAFLGFSHPRTGEPVSWEAPLPEDFRLVLEYLERLR
jgi:23S rRNA pseudouridine1911/1915/1917 synthase